MAALINFGHNYMSRAYFVNGFNDLNKTWMYELYGIVHVEMIENCQLIVTTGLCVYV